MICDITATLHNAIPWPYSYLYDVFTLGHVGATMLARTIHTRALFQYKDHLSRYGVSHVKDKMVTDEFVLSLTWGSLYWQDGIFILRRPPVYCHDDKIPVVSPHRETIMQQLFGIFFFFFFCCVLKHIGVWTTWHALCRWYFQIHFVELSYCW